jgi:hypothetical protein
LTALLQETPKVLTQIHRKKPMLSNWILALFIASLGLSGLYSYLYQAPTDSSHETGALSLFKDEDFSNLHQIILKNKMGSFRFEKSKSKSSNDWNMISPRSLPASQRVIETVLKELRSIRIRKVYPKEPINLANFSLDSPLVKITLTDIYGEKKVLTQGLKKFNNETYVVLSKKESIFQIDAIKTALETLSLTNFLDSKVVSLHPENIAFLRIYRGDKNSKRLQFSIYKDKAGWKSSDGTLLDPVKINKYVQELSSLPSQQILDEQSEKLRESLQDFLTTPQYTLELEDANKNLFTYTLSNLINSLPDIKLEKRQSFIITASNREHPYIINKSFLQLFNKRLNLFKPKKVPFKKLFY